MLHFFSRVATDAGMARRRKPGRPRNLIPSRVIPVLLPEPLFELAGTIGRVEGLPRATWAARELTKAIDRHQRRVARL
jgi:hypothetical protein